MAITGEGSDPAHRSTNRAVGLELSAFPAGSVIGGRLGLADPGRAPAGTGHLIGIISDSLHRQMEGRSIARWREGPSPDGGKARFRIQMN